eukprot:GILI01010992.1.p1 GENE.GILI01010992.1~~GILI01010992.1.p1  ORF type:complete len:520 (+),score=143.56 GILI01010992.1:153-1712(+)
MGAIDQDGSLVFKQLFDVNCFTAVFQTLTCMLLLWSVIRGRGIKGRPYGPEGPPESGFIGVIVCMFSSFLYVCKSIDWGNKGTANLSFNKYWYSDYLVTCPLIVLDLCFTFEIHYKLVYFVSTFITLLFAVLSFTEDAPARYWHFGIGSAFFAVFFYSIAKILMQRWRTVPEPGRIPMFVGLLIFFGMWPVFPVLWIFSWVGSGYITMHQYYIIHCFLDITCKTFFSFACLLYRVRVEEWQWQAEVCIDPRLAEQEVAEALKPKTVMVGGKQYQVNKAIDFEDTGSVISSLSQHEAIHEGSIITAVPNSPLPGDESGRSMGRRTSLPFNRRSGGSNTLVISHSTLPPPPSAMMPYQPQPDYGAPAPLDSDAFKQEIARAITEAISASFRRMDPSGARNPSPPPGVMGRTMQSQILTPPSVNDNIPRSSPNSPLPPPFGQTGAIPVVPANPARAARKATLSVNVRSNQQRNTRAMVVGPFQDEPTQAPLYLPPTAAGPGYEQRRSQPTATARGDDDWIDE